MVVSRIRVTTEPNFIKPHSFHSVLVVKHFLAYRHLFSLNLHQSAVHSWSEPWSSSLSSFFEEGVDRRLFWCADVSSMSPMFSALSPKFLLVFVPGPPNLESNPKFVLPFGWKPPARLVLKNPLPIFDNSILWLTSFTPVGYWPYRLLKLLSVPLPAVAAPVSSGAAPVRVLEYIPGV